MNLKELLFWGYGTGRLIAVCSFVARIIEGARDSKVFRPPNPWLMALLGVLREMYETEDLKMNIKFEVQVLCKNINIKIEDIQRTSQLTTIPVPIKDSRNPDFNVKAAAATPTTTGQSPMSGVSSAASAAAMQNIQQGLIMPQTAEEASIDEANKQSSGEVNGAGPGSQEQTVIPNLAAYVTINPSLQFFATNPAQRRLVSLAVDRAIREIIQPVVERSVTIASVTTKQLILKDFSTEPNEQQLRNGAHLMISNLAGSLALVTCKEPLRVSIGNHLRSLLQQVTSDQSLIEQIVQVCSNDNLELGCMLIEKASTEKAIRDVDESLAVAIQSRRKSREANQPFVDSSIKLGGKYPRELPDALKPNIGGLHPQQLLVYEGFQRARAMAVAAQQQQQVRLSPSSYPYLSLNFLSSSLLFPSSSSLSSSTLFFISSHFFLSPSSSSSSHFSPKLLCILYYLMTSKSLLLILVFLGTFSPLSDADGCHKIPIFLIFHFLLFLIQLLFSVTQPHLLYLNAHKPLHPVTTQLVIFNPIQISSYNSILFFQFLFLTATAEYECHELPCPVWNAGSRSSANDLSSTVRCICTQSIYESSSGWLPASLIPYRHEVKTVCLLINMFLSALSRLC